MSDQKNRRLAYGAGTPEYFEDSCLPRHGGRLPKISPEDIIAATRVFGKYRSVIADFLGVTVQTIDMYEKLYPDVKQAFQDAHARRIDTYEITLDEMRNKHEPSAVYFFLKCQAKDRGYVEHPQVQTGDVTINVNAPDKYKPETNGDDTRTAHSAHSADDAAEYELE